MNDQYSNILVEFFERMTSWENGIVADREISLPQMHLLEVVGNHAPVRMKELSERLGVTTGTLTVMVHRLAAKGYVEKIQDDQDRRSYFIRLTESGAAEYENHHHMHGHLIDEITSVLGEGASDTFFRNLQIVQDLM